MFAVADQKMEFEERCCTNNELVIANVYKILSQFTVEDEYVKDCMIKWSKTWFIILCLINGNICGHKV